MSSIKFNCVIDGKKTSTTLSENLVRFYINALRNNEKYTIWFDLILRTNSKYHFEIDQKSKAIVQKEITAMRDLKHKDDIEFRILKHIAYMTR